MDGLEQTYGARLAVRRLLFTSDEGQALAQRYGVNGHPTIVLVDRAGEARARFFGIPEEAPLEQAVAELLT